MGLFIDHFRESDEQCISVIESVAFQILFGSPTNNAYGLLNAVCSLRRLELYKYYLDCVVCLISSWVVILRRFCSF